VISGSGAPRSSAFEGVPPGAERLCRRSFQHLARRHALILQRRQHACEHGFGNERQRRAEVERVLAGPLAGALLRRTVENHVDEILAGFLVFLAENFRCDFNQVTVELALIPLGVDLAQFFIGQARHLLEHRIAFGDQLHVAVFNAVVHHLHEVACAVRTHVGNARLAVRRFRGDFGENRRNQVVSVALAARHDGRPFQRAFFTARHAGADEMQPGLCQFLIAANGVGEMRVAAVDENIALFQQRLERCNGGVRRLARLHHEQNAARFFQRFDELFQRERRHQLPVRIFGDEFVGLFAATVVDRHRVAAALDVERQIAAHDR